MALSVCESVREEVHVEGKLQLKINKEQCCVFRKHLNCMTRAQLSSCLACLFVCRIFLFQSAKRGRWNPLKEN